MRNCHNCGSKIEKRMKVLMCKCGSSLCSKCGGMCKDCLIISEDKKQYVDYLVDKYRERIMG